MRILIVIVLALGVIALLIALPVLGFAALGSFGILADVSLEENREYGRQLFWLGLPPLIGGAVLCVLGLLLFAWNDRRSNVDQAVPG